MKSWWDAFIPSSFAYRFSVFTKAYLVAQLDCNSSPWHWNPSGRLLPCDMVPSVEIQSCTQPQCVWKSLCVGPSLFIGGVLHKRFLGYFFIRVYVQWKSFSPVNWSQDFSRDAMLNYYCAITVLSFMFVWFFSPYFLEFKYCKYISKNEISYTVKF